MSKSFIVRSYQEGDENSIVELLKLAFPDWNNLKNPLDHWKWKYRYAPSGTDIVVADNGEKIIGVSHSILFKIKMGPSLFLSQSGGDTTTHPDYRGMGVYSKIHDKKEGLFEIAISTNPTILKDSYKRGHVAFPHRIVYMVRIKDVDLHLRKRPIKNKLLYRYGYSIFKTWNNISNSLKKSPKIEDDFIIEDIKGFDDRINIFWEKVKNEYNFILEKSSDYLNWRYFDPRAGNYLVKQATRNGEILGFVALRLQNEGGYSEGYVFDLLSLPSRPDVSITLLKEACNYFESIGTNVVYYMVVKDHPYYTYSSRFGFFDSRSSANIICTLSNRIDEFQILKSSYPSKVYFSYGGYF